MEILAREVGAAFGNFEREAEEAVSDCIAGFEKSASDKLALCEAQFVAKMAELETKIASVSEIERRLADRLASLSDGKDGRDGVSVTLDDVFPALSAQVSETVKATVEETLATWERPADGKSITVEDVEPMLRAAVAEAAEAVPAGKDGKDADPEVMRAMIEELVATIPVPKDGRDGIDGKDGDPGPQGERGFGLDDFDTELIEDGRTLLMKFVRGDTALVHEIPLPAGPAGKDGLDGKDGERGEKGAMGALPVVKNWEDRVYYEGEVVSFDGGIYQASKDTGKAPSHEDWTCIVTAGRDGAEGRSFAIRGTWEAGIEYSAFDVVACNGASFVATTDNPGECPGEGWQMMAAQGKRGKPGERGPAGVGLRGIAGPKVENMSINDNGMLCLRNADGSVVECDLYPILAKIGG